MLEFKCRINEGKISNVMHWYYIYDNVKVMAYEISLIFWKTIFMYNNVDVYRNITLRTIHSIVLKDYAKWLVKLLNFTNRMIL